MAMQALVMGFGGTGAHILTALKEMTVLKHGVKPESIKFLLFDTIADWRPGKTVPIMGGAAEEVVAQGSEEKTSLDPATEYFYLKDHDPDLKAHVYELLSPSRSPEKYPHLKDWLAAPWLKVHVKPASLSIVEGAAQQRQIGRFATFQNADRIIGRIQQMIADLSRHAGSSAINVWLIGSAAGGTGAGCLLDAAYLTHRAARNIDANVTITGVIVLPDVYNDKPGISRARAYSLFRELERLQGLGIEKGSAEAAMEFTSRVFYDARKMLESSVPKGIFDDLFYLGRECRREEERISFFTSIASAIDPYLDQFSGPVLIQEAVNKTAPALSFGASRLYVPEETFADIFAWEEVEKYLRGVTAPDDNRYVRHGSLSEREEAARTKVENLLPLFDELLQRADSSSPSKPTYTPAQNRAYVKNTVTPEKIITEWYRFGGGSIAGIELNQAQKSAVLLTHVNPYISFTETDETKVALEDRTTKTFKENEKVKGQKENQEESRDRFVKSLDDITRRYLDRDSSDRSMEKGRRQVMEVIKGNLHKKVDEMIIGELRQSTKFTVDPRNLNQGTVLTRLWAELEYALSDNGPLRKIEALSGQFVSWLNEEESDRGKQPVDALNQLKQSKSSGFLSFGVWVEDYQKQARDQCYEYIRWYQKRELLKDMQDFIRSVIERFEHWHRLMRQVFDNLALKEPDAALYTVEKIILDRELNGRLQRLGQNSSARISCETFNPINPDLTMQGYREELKKCVDVRSDVTLAGEALSDTKWEAGVDENGTPQLKLVISGADGAGAYGTETMARLHQVLHDHFRKRMEGYLKDKDIFDYLLYVQRERGLNTDEIAKILNSAADILLNAKGDDECRLVYKDPQNPDKRNLAGAISESLRNISEGVNVTDSEKNYSDKNSITLLKIKRPDMERINDLNQCKKHYVEMQTTDKTGGDKHDTEVYRAQVYHAFRAELEAWFIERKYCKDRGIASDDHQIPPRVVRLLDDPEMMQAFVHCLATGAIEKKKQDDGRWIWVWHDTQNNREVLLVDTPEADVIQVGVVFVLNQREGRKGGKIQITFDAAMKSATDAAKSKPDDKSKGDLLSEFRKNLDAFLKERLAQEKINDIEIERNRKKQERLGLKMVLDFYADPNTVTQIQHRMDL